MDDEILEQEPETVNEPEPLVIETKGKWQMFEYMAKVKFEIGKTYKIQIQGDCMFAISKEKPTNGLKTNEIEYTKDSNNILWIKTGG